MILINNTIMVFVFANRTHVTAFMEFACPNSFHAEWCAAIVGGAIYKMISIAYVCSIVSSCMRCAF